MAGILSHLDRNELPAEKPVSNPSNNGRTIKQQLQPKILMQSNQTSNSNVN